MPDSNLATNCKQEWSKREFGNNPKSVAPPRLEDSEGKRKPQKKLKSVADINYEPERSKRNHGKVKNLLTFCLKMLAK